MSGRVPQARGGKKPPQMTLKEKRAAKRAEREVGGLIKPRKASRG